VLERVDSSRQEIGGNPCYVREYAGSEGGATVNIRLVCGTTPWSGTLTGSWSRPPDRLEPGATLEMTVRGSVTASHAAITASGQVYADFDALPCGGRGAGSGHIAWIQLESNPRGTRQRGEQTGTGIVPGLGRGGPEERLQVRACMDGWQTYFIYRWSAAGTAAGGAGRQGGAPALDPTITRNVAILQYCRPLVDAAAPELEELNRAIERDNAEIALWVRQQMEEASAWHEFVWAASSVLSFGVGHVQEGQRHPGRVLAHVNQAIGAREFLGDLSRRCRDQIAQSEAQLAAAHVDATAYANAHAGPVAEALRIHRTDELARLNAACQRAFESMMFNRSLFNSNPAELRWGTRANQEAGFQTACLEWHRRIAAAN
jgi:hypothetical protein